MKIAFLGNFDVSFSSETHHAKSLQALGHQVATFQETKAPTEVILEEALRSDLFVWVHTHGWEQPGRHTMREVLRALREDGVPSVTYHLDLWMGLERQKDMQSDDYWGIEHFFTVDPQMAAWLNANTPIKGHFLWAGVFHEEAYATAPQPGCPFDVAFVGSRGYHPEWPHRYQLLDWLTKHYGSRFAHYGGDGRGVVRGKQLNRIYADVPIIVGDSLYLGPQHNGYSSDRLFESLGRFAFLVYPYIPGLDEIVEDRKHLAFYNFGDFDELEWTIQYFLDHPEERETIRRCGHEHVKQTCTYRHRWQTILEIVKP